MSRVKESGRPLGLPGMTATGPNTAQVALTNPHGDVVATIPDTANASPASMSGISDYDEYGQLLNGPRPGSAAGQ